MWLIVCLFGCPIVSEADLDKVRDADLDGIAAIAFGGNDCDDNDDTIYPGAVDEWYDGIDSNCDGVDDYDADGDGVPTERDGDPDTPADCDDTDPTVGEAAMMLWVDSDTDGYGTGDPVAHCDAELGWALIDGDCDDSDGARNPGAAEVWYNGIDEDCDALDDDQDGDGLVLADDCDDTMPSVGERTEYIIDVDGDGFGAQGTEGLLLCAEEAASSGFVDDATDCDDTRSDVHPDAIEVCDPDSTDEDCDGLADDEDDGAIGQGLTYYQDFDKDGWGHDDSVVSLCDEPAPPPFVDGETEYDWVTDGGDCFDQLGALDEPLPLGRWNPYDFNPDTQWFVDRDGDVYGDPEEPSGQYGCEPVPLHAPNDGDCNDDDRATNPGATDRDLFITSPTSKLLSLFDEDCQGDSEVDLDDDGWPNLLSEAVPSLDPCPFAGSVRVREGDDLALVIFAAPACSRVEIDTGTYGTFAIDKPMVVVAAKGAEVVIEAEPAEVLGMAIISDNVVVSGLTFRGYDNGAYIGGQALIENTTFEDGLLAIQTDAVQAILFDVTIRDHVFGIELLQDNLLGVATNQPTLWISESTLSGLSSPSHGIFGGETLFGPHPNLLVFNSVFEDNTSTTGVISGVYASLLLARTRFSSSTGMQLWSTITDELIIQDVTVEDCVTTAPHLLLASGFDAALGVVATIEDLVVRDNLWFSDSALFSLSGFAFVAFDGFNDTSLSDVRLSGNKDLESNDAGPWLRSIDLYNEADNRKVQNLLISGDGGTGMMLRGGAVSQATIVGMKDAVWPLEQPTSVESSILWGNERLRRNQAYSGLLPGTLQFTDSVVPFSSADTVGCVDTGQPCATSDPQFLRYHPNLPSSVWDLYLGPNSPYLSTDPIPADEWPCPAPGEPADTSVVATQLGAFGYKGEAVIADEHAIDYYSCWFDPVGKPVIYDRWQREHIAHQAHVEVQNPNGPQPGDPDDDGLDNAAEFIMGTLPQVADTDGDFYDDPFDPGPLDPCSPDKCILICPTAEDDPEC